MSGARAAAPSAFSARVIVALLIVGVFSFSAFITLSTFAPEFRRGDNGEAHALSRSAVGFAGAVELLATVGTPVTINRKTGDGGNTLVVLTPPTSLSREQLKARHGSRTLIILPKWSAAPVPEHPGWVASLGTMPEKVAIASLSDLAPHVTLSRAKGSAKVTLRINGEELTSGTISELQSLSGNEITPEITTADGRIIVARLRSEPETSILADPDFLNTQGLYDVNTARVGLTILDEVRDYGWPIAFDVTLNGLETAPNLLRLALTPPLLGATLSLIAAAALLAWRSVMQSGPRIRPGRAIALGKRALAENSAALIRLAGREHTMGWRYAILTAASAAEQIGAPRAEGGETIAMLDRVGATQGMSQSYSALAADAANARNSAEVVAAARQLYAWTEEMLRAAR